MRICSTVDLMIVRDVTVSTHGAESFFLFDSLHIYQWHMLVGGLITIAVAEGISYLITRQILNESSENSREPEDV